MEQNFRSENVACLILSGGLSQRMKSPKALLRYSESENFLEHLIHVYHEAGIQEVVVVMNASIDTADLDTGFNKTTLIKNNFPDRGRLFSLQLGLAAAANADYCFIQNIDNPFVTVELIRQLKGSAARAEYVTPVFNGKGGHPILISSPVIKEIMKEKNYEKTLREVLTDFSRYRMKTDDERIHWNTNSPADYDQYFFADA